MKKCGGNGPLVFSSILFGLLSLVFVVFFIMLFLWSDGISASLSRIALSENRLPATLTVFGRSSYSQRVGSLGEGDMNTLSARIDFFTAEGAVAGTVERSWSGWELKLDCIIIGTGKGWIVFPFMAYTDETKRGGGVNLFRYYTKNGFPVLYESSALLPEERSNLKRLFSIIRTEQWMPGVLGSFHHETVSIRSFEAGIPYSLYVTKEGKLQLRSN